MSKENGTLPRAGDMEIKDYATREEKKAVYCEFNAALRAGRLVKSSVCDWCGSDARIEAHHPDYNRPLMVVWICRRCHMAHHSKYHNEQWLRATNAFAG